MTTATQTKRRWRSLGELEGSPEFQKFLHREFPTSASELPAGVSRRRWMQLMGASFALATVAGCRWETERIAPFAERPDGRIPGEAQKFATSIELAGGVRNLLVTCYDGRPIKVEGNSDHPQSRGATDIYAQAAILDLYDPDRSSELRQRIERQSFVRDWDDFSKWAQQHLADAQSSDGRGVALLIEPTASPSMHAMFERFRTTFPKARLFEHSSLPRVHRHPGSGERFDAAYRTQYDLSQARVIVCLDEDLIGRHPNAISNARGYAERRDPDGDWMNRMYCVESQFSITGAAADHRLPLKSSKIGKWLSLLEQAIHEHETSGDTFTDEVLEEGSDEYRFLHAVAEDLVAHRGQAFIAVGQHQPTEVHARVQQLNARLRNVGSTVRYSVDPTAIADLGDLEQLTLAMQSGSVETLLILGGNPVFDALGDVPFAEALSKIKHSIRLGVYEDETSRLCQWHLPQAHAFEAWGDVRAFDGTYSVSQPLIEPLLNGKSGIEVLSLLTSYWREPMQIVRDSARDLVGKPLSDKDWRRLIHDGFTAGPQLASLQPIAANGEAAELASGGGIDELELVFTASDTTYDGRFGNNGWLQETPDALTKLTWDNAAILSPRTANALGIEHATLVDVAVGDKTLRVPAFVLPGQADGSIGLAVGYGRTAAGHVGGSAIDDVTPVGVNVNRLRTTASPFVATKVSITPTGEAYKLATTQEHHAIDSLGFEEIGQRVRELVREGTIEEYREHPDFAHHDDHHPPLKSLWEEPSYDGHAWGMAIDLNKCIGCNACMVACQSENNVPIVGKDQVALGREMHWLRTDRYFTGDVSNPQVATQPVACHHCENAPCEQVCPVAATVHSDEGLNDMIYNRCVGTRYCANNCPYKVRRFNFFDNSKQFTEPGRELVQLAVNPEVSVRSRGVMEKCTYCVQRIQHAKIDAGNDRRPIRDGEIQTACQQACPTQAIEFGDLNQKDSRVAEAHADPRAYGMLAELNVKPRTKYLARIRNLHPWLASNSHLDPLAKDEGGRGHHGDS